MIKVYLRGMNSVCDPIRAKVLAMAHTYLEGDDETRSFLKQSANFFPLSPDPARPNQKQALVIQFAGEICLIEQTQQKQLFIRDYHEVAMQRRENGIS